MQPIVRKFLGGYIIIFKTWITLRIYLLEVLALLEGILPQGRLYYVLFAIEVSICAKRNYNLKIYKKNIEGRLYQVFTILTLTYSEAYLQ